MENSNKESENSVDPSTSPNENKTPENEKSTADDPKPVSSNLMVVDSEMPSTSSCLNEDEEMSSITTTTTNDHTDTLPNRSGLLENLIRKKRFSSRNYRGRFGVHTSDSSTSDDDEEMRDNATAVASKRQKKHEPRTPCPPPPEYLDDLAAAAADDGGDERTSEHDNGDETVNSELSSSSSSSSSDTDFDNHLSEATTEDDDDDIDVSFLNIERPKCTWVALRELYYREHGLSGNGRRSLSGRDPQMFKTRITGSLNCVERLELMAKLERHDGCVNGLNFSPDGHLLASGSDDLNVVLWNWATGTVSRIFKSGHQHNVFQTKFYGNGPDIQLITTARDGYVRNHVVPSSGGKPYSSTLYKHVGAVHRSTVGQNHPYDVITAGEDGIVISIDMRERKTNRLVTVKNEKRKVVLYGVSANPFYNEFCVYGRDKLVRVYDRRNCKTVMKNYFPDSLTHKKTYGTSVTAAVYNHQGDEILASYADDDIFLFNRNDEEGQFHQRYKGHLNSQTIKGVNFFGSGSEFIVSGSDCGNIFFWDKKTTKIVQWMRGDENGAVNVLEPHPEFPFLATSGIDSDVKIWVPSNEKPPDLTGLEKCVKRNMKMRTKSMAGEDLFDEDFLRLIMQRRLRSFRRVVNRDYALSTEMSNGSGDEEEEPTVNINTSSSIDSDSDGNDENPRSREIFPCSPM